MVTFTINDQNNNDNGLEVYTHEADNSTMQIEITSPLIANANFFTQIILIDADHNSQTGYSTAKFNYIGAE